MQNVKDWILRVERFFNTKAWRWASEINKIIYLAKVSEQKATGFAFQYSNRMEGVRGELIHPEYSFSDNFVVHLMQTFAAKEEVRKAKELMRELQNTNIGEYLQECQSLKIMMRAAGMTEKKRCSCYRPEKSSA